MEERKKPTRPFSVIYADAKQALTRQVGNTMAGLRAAYFYGRGNFEWIWLRSRPCRK